ALRLNPDDGMALTGLAVLALRQGRFDVAVAQLEHAVKVDPNDLNVLLFAQALRRAGRAAEADSALAQVQKISADPGQAQTAAGQFLSFAGLKTTPSVRPPYALYDCCGRADLQFRACAATRPSVAIAAARTLLAEMLDR